MCSAVFAHVHSDCRAGTDQSAATVGISASTTKPAAFRTSNSPSILRPLLRRESAFYQGSVCCLTPGHSSLRDQVFDHGAANCSGGEPPPRRPRGDDSLITAGAPTRCSGFVEGCHEHQVWFGN